MGANAIAAMLEARGVQLEFVLDEGGPLLVDGLRPFVRNTAVALVGTAEKVPPWHPESLLARRCVV